MECTLALVGDGYTLVAADRNAARSIICFKKDEDKVTVLDSHKIMGSSGAIRRPAVPSRRRRDSSPGMMEVGRFFVDFGSLEGVGAIVAAWGVRGRGDGVSVIVRA